MDLCADPAQVWADQGSDVRQAKTEEGQEGIFYRGGRVSLFFAHLIGKWVLVSGRRKKMTKDGVNIAVTVER